jgi:hypothetical protein
MSHRSDQGIRTTKVPLVGLLWAGLVFTIGMEIILAIALPSGYAWFLMAVAAIVDVAAVIYLTRRVRTEWRITRMHKATSEEDREVLRWEIRQAISELDRRGQLQGSSDERAEYVNSRGLECVSTGSVTSLLRDGRA